MIKAMWVAQTMLFASTTFVLGQAGKTQSAPGDTPPPHVLSQTGTMYDGNNANLQLPAEPNRYWVSFGPRRSRREAPRPPPQPRQANIDPLPPPLSSFRILSDPAADVTSHRPKRKEIR